MSTIIRPETSIKNEYWLGRHRYYELKHFCMQYPEWKRALLEFDGYSKCSNETERITSSNISNPTEICALNREYYVSRIKMVEEAVFATGSDLAKYVLRGVTEGMSYSHLKARLDIPCSKDTYYKEYRKFFWILDKAQQGLFSFSCFRA